MATKNRTIIKKYADRWHKEACHLYAKWLNAKRQDDEEAADYYFSKYITAGDNWINYTKFAH